MVNVNTKTDKAEIFTIINKSKILDLGEEKKAKVPVEILTEHEQVFRFELQPQVSAVLFLAN